jgi:hypothetical protein
MIYCLDTVIKFVGVLCAPMSVEGDVIVFGFVLDGAK